MSETLRLSDAWGGVAASWAIGVPRSRVTAILLGIVLVVAKPEAVRAVPDGSLPANPVIEPIGSGNNPVKLGFSYFGDAFADVSGGRSTGLTYQGRLGILLDVDLDRALGWRGATFHASAHQIHGASTTAAHVGALNDVSGLEAEPNTRLNNLWLEQAFGPRLSVRIGQFTAAQEFLISSTAAFFVNADFGWPTIAAQALPSGGPAYPIATPGVRVSFKPDPRTTLLAAIFNGDPAGPGGGDPQQRDGDGLNSLRLSGPPFLLAEVQHGVGTAGGDPVTTLKIGGWWYLGDVADQRRALQGLPVTDPAGSRAAAKRRGDYEIYAIVDQAVAKTANGAVSAFGRVAFSPSDRNLIDLSVDGGLNWKGPFAGRNVDTVGVAFGYTHLSPGPSGGNAGGISRARGPEAVAELSYSAKLSSAWSVQPDVQYILHPREYALQAALAVRPAVATPSAIVLGIRNVVHF